MKKYSINLDIIQEKLYNKKENNYLSICRGSKSQVRVKLQANAVTPYNKSCGQTVHEGLC